MGLTVLLLERTTPGVRGELTRWMLELGPNVFVGTLGRRVRETLWDYVQGKRRATGGCVLVFAAPTEQGFTIVVSGQTDRDVVDFEGLLLVRRPPAGRPSAL